MPRTDNRVPNFSCSLKMARHWKKIQVTYLVKFNELEKLPRTLQLERIDEGQGIEAAMVANEAKWHHMYASLQKHNAEKSGEEDTSKP